MSSVTAHPTAAMDIDDERPRLRSSPGLVEIQNHRTVTRQRRVSEIGQSDHVTGENNATLRIAIVEHWTCAHTRFRRTYGAGARAEHSQQRQNESYRFHVAPHSAWHRSLLDRCGRHLMKAAHHAALVGRVPCHDL